MHTVTKRPIKIAMISLFAYQFFNSTCLVPGAGAELQLYCMATELAKDKLFDVNFIVGDHGQPLRETRQGVQLFRLSRPDRKLNKLFIAFKTIFNFLFVLYQINADVYIQRSSGVETFLVYLYCICMRKKFVYMISHDEDVLKEKTSLMPKGRKGKIVWKLYTVGLRGANLVVSQHKKQSELLEKNWNKKSIIRNSAHILPEISRSNKDNNGYVLWNARCEEWKQPFVFLDLAKEFPNTSFIMICLKNSNNLVLSEKVKTHVEKFPNVIFIDTLPPEQFDNYFAHAILHINTSLREGFPNTFIQAFKHSTPVLSFIVNPENIFDEYSIGKCAKGNFDHLKKFLKELLENKYLRNEFAKNAYQYVQQKHDIKKIIEEDKKIIMRVLD
ncbi:MAG: glycosyltransferase [Oligoflexia bacterium]|nr:glycosyltransferase [Oligoflexia bacterium]